MANGPIEARQNESDSIAEKYFLRLLQRNFVLSELTQAGRETAGRLFPSDRTLNYKFENKPTGADAQVSPDEVYLDDLMLLFSPFDFRANGGGYQLMFQLATTAQTPQELQNIFNGIKTVEKAWGQERPYDDYRTERDLTRSSREDFFKQGRRELQSSSTTPETRWVYTEIDKVFTREDKTGDRRDDMKEIGIRLFSLDSGSFEKYKSALAETYLYLILTQDFAYGWNERFAQGTEYFPFEETIFAEDTTFWRQVDGSWVGLPSNFSDRQLSKIILPTNKELENKQREPDNSLFDLYTRFASERASWEVERGKLRSRSADLEEALNVVRADLIKAREANDVLRAQLEARSGRIPQGGGETDALSDFLRNLGLTKEGILQMSAVERKKIISRLQRFAANAFHPNNGLSPNEQRLKDINSALDELNRN